MSQTIRLTGITWDHSRAFPPLVATAQRFEETHPGVRIEWKKRTLDEFGHQPLDEIAGTFDLIIIDHPWAGFAFEKGLVRDLKPLLAPASFEDYAQNSIGASFQSYCYAGGLLALPIDAATPAPSWRPDLLERFGVAVPTNWTEAVALAHRKLAVIPAFNADLFLYFLMLVNALGPSLGADPDELAPRAVMGAALQLLRELTEPMPSAIFDWNPIQLAEIMSSTAQFAWNAFGYTYNNYARAGFARAQLQFGNLLSLKPNGSRLRSVLGGTGIALSSHCQDVETALAYARFVAEGAIQKGIYLAAGGQPAHRASWNDSSADVLCGGFFSSTRTAQEEAFIRPRYSGYVSIQTTGGLALQEALRDGRDADAVLEKLNALYRNSRKCGSALFQSN